MSILDTYMQADSGNSESFKILPKKLPIKKLGKEYKKLAGYVKINTLSRLKDILLVDDLVDKEEVEILVNFNFSDLGFSRKVIEANVNQEVKLKCQRCLQGMVYNICAEIKIVLVKKFEEISGKFSSYEQITTDNNELFDLYQLLEDEMILSLPIVIKHDDTNEECRKFSDFSI